MKFTLRPFLSFCVFITLFLGLASRSAAADPDEKVILEMNERVTVLNKQVLNNPDPKAVVELQKQIAAIYDEFLPKLSETGRANLTVVLNVVRPLQEEGFAYNKSIADFSESPQSDFTTIKSREDIQARLTQLTTLEQANLKLIARIEAFESDVTKQLDKTKLSAAEKRGFLAGLNSSLSRQIGPLQAIRNIDISIYAQMKAALNLLNTHWGKWKAEDYIVWEDSALEAEFDKIATEIATLAQRQANAQQTLSGRL